MSTVLSKESIRFPKKYLDAYPDLFEAIDDLDFLSREEDESGIVIFWDDNPGAETCFGHVIDVLENYRLPHDCWVVFNVDDGYSKLFYRPDLSDKAFELNEDEEIMIPASTLKSLDKGNQDYACIGYKFVEFLNTYVPDLPPIENYV